MKLSRRFACTHLGASKRQEWTPACCLACTHLCRCEAPGQAVVEAQSVGARNTDHDQGMVGMWGLAGTLRGAPRHCRAPLIEELLLRPLRPRHPAPSAADPGAAAAAATTLLRLLLLLRPGRPRCSRLCLEPIKTGNDGSVQAAGGVCTLKVVSLLLLLKGLEVVEHEGGRAGALVEGLQSAEV